MSTTTKPTTAKGQKYDGFTGEERDAMKERAKELKTSARRGAAKGDTEGEVLTKIAEMAEPDRVIAERLHALIKAGAPTLTAKLWYGMPAYARNGKIICFFQPAAKFKARYATLGFSDEAKLDEGAMWPASYALTELTADAEAMIVALLRRAVS
ncbi:iron chaperone [Microbispora bryophytorum]|uniref:iron chaperone n=1 Tax=Microbispora bryophytorum TaxID=1460882 RepID=UPI0033CE856E